MHINSHLRLERIDIPWTSHKFRHFHMRSGHTSLGRPRFAQLSTNPLVLGPHAPRCVLDVTLDLQLIEPFFRRELSIERYALTFDCRKVSWRQEFHERELQLPLLFRGGSYGGDRPGEAGFAQEHGPTLSHVEFEKLHFECKAAQCRGIEVSK